MYIYAQYITQPLFKCITTVRIAAVQSGQDFSSILQEDKLTEFEFHGLFIIEIGCNFCCLEGQKKAADPWKIFYQSASD